jgi:AcrR family transcriptional regulator
MPKNTFFTRDMLLDAAFGIFREEGLEAVSVRRIAAVTGSSTAPIYSCFANVDEMREALIQSAFEKLLRYTEREYTENLFLNIGVGTLEFAKENPIVYRTVFLADARGKAMYDNLFAINRTQMMKEKTMEIFSDQEINTILEKLTVYTYGLASLICAGVMAETSTENLIRVLGQTGGDIIGATAFFAGKFETFLAMENGIEGGFREKNCNS